MDAGITLSAPLSPGARFRFPYGLPCRKALEINSRAFYCFISYIPTCFKLFYVKILPQILIFFRVRYVFRVQIGNGLATKPGTI